MTDQVMTEMDEHLSREDRVPVIAIGLSAGAAILAAGNVFAKFFL
jgi:hypothetical protein